MCRDRTIVVGDGNILKHSGCEQALWSTAQVIERSETIRSKHSRSQVRRYECGYGNSIVG